MDLEDAGFLNIGIPHPSAGLLPATPVTATSASALDCIDYGEGLTRILSQLSEVQRDIITMMQSHHDDHIRALNGPQTMFATPTATDIGTAVQDAVQGSLTNVVIPVICSTSFTTWST